MSRLVFAAVLATGLVATAPIEAQMFRWLAFGDSITLGNYDNPGGGGYPARLHNRLNCSPGVCEVFNSGMSGEQTYEAKTRIDQVLNNQGPFDVMLLMEGTNDIFQDVSAETVTQNLRIIANKAANHGVETVHGSIIWFHYQGEYGTSKNSVVKALRDKLSSLANSQRRYFVDIWDELCPNAHPDRHGHGQISCFNQHYSETCEGRPPPCGDNRGHPIASGYDMMAARWYEGITAANVPAKPVLVSPSGSVSGASQTLEWNKASRTTWYRLILEDESGKVVDTWLEGRAVCGSSLCSFEVGDLEEGGYAWKVRGRNPAGHGPWSDEMAFTYQIMFADNFETGSAGAWDEIQP